MPDDGTGTVEDTTTAEATVDGLTDDQWAKELGLDLADNKELEEVDEKEISTEKEDTDGDDDSKGKDSDKSKPVADATKSDADAKGDAKADTEELEEELREDESGDKKEAADDPNTFKSLGRDPVTEFKVGDAEGEIEIPNLVFSYKADGRDHEDVPIDKVLHMAQMGHYNHRREQELTQREQQITQVQSQAQSAIAQNQQLNQKLADIGQQVTRLFEDSDYFELAREKHERLNSPEQRVLRAEQETQQLRFQQAQLAEDQQVQGFIANTMLPMFQTIQKNSTNVTEEELLGRYTALTAPLLDRGRIPLNRLMDAQRIVETDLAQWAKQVHEGRQTTEDAKDSKLAEQREKTAKAKRKLARTAAPKGAAAPSTPKKKRPKATDSADDTMDELFRELDAEAV